jgi:hypothetical protein
LGGVQRRQVKAQDGSNTAYWTAALKRFRKRTSQVCKTKRHEQHLRRSGNAANDWCPPPILRTASGQTQPAVDADAVTVTTFVVATSGCDGVRLASRYKRISAERIVEADAILVNDINYLDTAVDARAIALLAYVVAMGKTIVPVSAVHDGGIVHEGECLQHRRRIDVSHCDISVGSTLHPTVVRALESSCGIRGSRWRMLPAGETPLARPQTQRRRAVVLNTLTDARAFLLSERHFTVSRTGGKFSKHPTRQV